MGSTASTAPRWDSSAMPSQCGRVAIATSANSGIGFSTAQMLVQRGAVVVLAFRSEARGRAAEDEINEFIKSTLCQTRLSLAPLTADGIETQFGVNHLIHFLLTALVLALLKAAPAARRQREQSGSPPCDVARVWHARKGTVHPWRRCGESKLANLLFTYELQRRLEAATVLNVISVAAHPGMSYTAIADKMIMSFSPKFLRSVVGWIVSLAPLNTSEQVALPTLYAASVASVKSGDYYGPDSFGGRRGYPVKEQSRPQSHNIEEAAQLWTLSEELIGERFQRWSHFRFGVWNKLFPFCGVKRTV